MQSSTKVIIFFKKAIYIVIFLHIFAFHFHHNEKTLPKQHARIANSIF